METKKELDFDAMERLAKVMNDSPTILKLGKNSFEIKALKPGTQWLIAEEAMKMKRNETDSFGDIIKEFAKNIPSVARVVTLAILNDKEKINGEDYNKVYETIMWDTELKDWVTLLVEILQMLSLDYFFDSTNVITMIREMALGRKTKMEEQKS